MLETAADILKKLRTAAFFFAQTLQPTIPYVNINQMSLKPFETKELPKALPLKKLIGPSFILLGLGLGSGEIILWPYLSSTYGLGIIWAAVLGITFQFFMNMEIERYALVRGESIFAGFARKKSWLPIWFIISTFVPWVWPGIVASSAKFLGFLFGLDNTKYLAIGMLVIIGLILSLGPVIYKTVESLQKVLISIGVPIIFILAIIVADKADWSALAQGVVGIGQGFRFLPAGINIAAFLGALAYAGAGGNLNLAQSSYIREKGYGMGKHAGRLTSILTGKQDENTSILGSRFETTDENIKEFKIWWKNINLEHLTIFWLTGAATILVLAMLSYSTTFNLAVKPEGINFVLQESIQIGKQLFPFAGSLFLVITGIMLFATQLTVLDATSRIISENVFLAKHEKIKEKHIPSVYYFILWAQILTGILIFLLGVTEPLELVTISAVLNAFTMFIHVGLTLWTNLTSLEKPLRPGTFRIFMMVAAFLFYGGFSAYTLIDKIFG